MTSSEGQRARRSLFIGAGALVLGLVVGIGAMRSCSVAPPPLIPALTSSVTFVRPTPDLLVAVRDLARLESAAFHMERVIDLTDQQSTLFGLITSEDAILLVAVAEITAGIDLGKLTAADVVADAVEGKASISLPAPELLHVTLDNQKTYVHTRKTGVLAARRENLETRARQEAERTLVQAAREQGLLTRAADNARRTVEVLVRSLGYRKVEVTVRSGS